MKVYSDNNKQDIEITQMHSFYSEQPELTSHLQKQTNHIQIVCNEETWNKDKVETTTETER